MARAFRSGLRLLPVALLLAVSAAGCFDAPELEDRWTRVDLTNTNLVPNQALVAGAMQPISLHAVVTYRAIVTGFLVAELRQSPTVVPGSVQLDPHAPRMNMATNIDTILANSVTRGRATRAVTGWNHLIQQFDLQFDGAVPATLDSTGAGGGGLYLLVYLGSGDKLRRDDGTDSLVVTPFPSSPMEILPVGMPLRLAP